MARTTTSRRAPEILSGRVFDIQRFSIHDGPGIRTTVFLKGCPLRCAWCHNPEGIGREPVLSFLLDRCIGCGHCVEVCPVHAHFIDRIGQHILDREKCVLTGECATVCPTKAMEIVGEDLSANRVLEIVLRDRLFYETSGGGMTISGGEPLLQIGFSAALLKGAKNAGVHTAIETCGHVNFVHFERVMAHTDLFLYDLKETDSERHFQYTGVDNKRILANLETLCDANASVLLRLPIVPGFNDRDDHFEAVARLTQRLPGLLGVEVMPYHSLGTSKHQRFGLETDGDSDPRPPTPETVSNWVETLRASGVTVVNEA